MLLCYCGSGLAAADCHLLLERCLYRGKRRSVRAQFPRGLTRARVERLAQGLRSMFPTSVLEDDNGIGIELRLVDFKPLYLRLTTLSTPEVPWLDGQWLDFTTWAPPFSDQITTLSRTENLESFRGRNVTDRAEDLLGFMEEISKAVTKTNDGKDLQASVRRASVHFREKFPQGYVDAVGVHPDLFRHMSAIGVLASLQALGEQDTETTISSNRSTPNTHHRLTQPARVIGVLQRANLPFSNGFPVYHVDHSFFFWFGQAVKLPQLEVTNMVLRYGEWIQRIDHSALDGVQVRQLAVWIVQRLNYVWAFLHDPGNFCDHDGYVDFTAQYQAHLAFSHIVQATSNILCAVDPPTQEHLLLHLLDTYAQLLSGGAIKGLFNEDFARRLGRYSKRLPSFAKTLLVQPAIEAWNEFGRTLLSEVLPSHIRPDGVRLMDHTIVDQRRFPGWFLQALRNNLAHGFGRLDRCLGVHSGQHSVLPLVKLVFPLFLTLLDNPRDFLGVAPSGLHRVSAPTFEI